MFSKRGCRVQRPQGRMFLALGEHEEVAWVAAVESGPLGVGQHPSLGGAGGPSRGQCTDRRGRGGGRGTLLVCFEIGANQELMLGVGGCRESWMLPTAQP